MSGAKHTPGPWRWEVNEKSKQVTLCGGVPMFDLTVMDFVRFGMGGAAPRFRTDRDNLNIMRRCEQWAKELPGREHHANWFKVIDHPDARLIEGAPAMDLMLRLIGEGLARIESNNGLREFCFDGLRYVLYDDYNSVMAVIGWGKARAAIAKAEGGRQWLR